MDLKSIGAGIAVATALGAGGLSGVDLAVENLQEESSRYQRVLRALDAKATETEKAHLAAVQELLDVRSKGEEPSSDDWLAVETSIDEARAKKDSPLLQKLDRFVERMDARDKQIRDDAVNLLNEI